MVIDGKLMATEIRSKIADQVRQMKKGLGKVPGLAVILVGQRRDSLTYVRNKIIACEEVGMKSVVTELPTDCADADVQNAVMRFNKDPSIHGILVQLPLPQVISESVTFCRNLMGYYFHDFLVQLFHDCHPPSPTLALIHFFISHHLLSFSIEPVWNNVYNGYGPILSWKWGRIRSK